MLGALALVKRVHANTQCIAGVCTNPVEHNIGSEKMSARVAVFVVTHCRVREGSQDLNKRQQSRAPRNTDVAALAWPIGMNAVFLQSILVIDTVLIGPLGEQALASLGLANSFALMISGIIFAFSSGTQMLVAQATGKGDVRARARWFMSGLIINLVIAAGACAFIFLLCPQLLPALASSAEMASGAFAYLSYFSLAIVGIAVGQNISVFFTATGHSRLPFYSNLVELPCNVVISYWLIYGGFGLAPMGLAGAALGSAVAAAIRSVLLIVALHRIHPECLSLGRSEPAVGGLSIGEHFRCALPISANFISMSASMSICMMIYAQLGVAQFAALSLLLPWMRMVGSIVTAWAQATGILVGQLLGGNALPVVEVFVVRAWLLAQVLAVVLSLSYLSLFVLFDWLYTELQAETSAYLWQLMPLLVFLPLVRTSNTVCGHVLRAGGDAAYVLKIHATAQWLLTVPLSYLLVAHFQLSVVWVFAVVVLEEVVKLLPFWLRLKRGLWKRGLLTGTP